MVRKKPPAKCKAPPPKKPRGPDPWTTCTWCHKRIPEDVEVFALKAKARPEVDLGAAQGQAIPLVLALVNRTVSAIVPTRDSEAKRAGVDLLFMICSAACGEQLKEALQKDKHLVESFRSDPFLN